MVASEAAGAAEYTAGDYAVCPVSGVAGADLAGDGLDSVDASFAADESA